MHVEVGSNGIRNSLCQMVGGRGRNSGVGSLRRQRLQLRWAEQSTPPPATYTVGGTISGLTVDGLVLANNGTTLTVNSGASTFSFGTALATGSAYAVTVQTTRMD